MTGAAALALVLHAAKAAAADVVHFESPHVHPIEILPGGARLAAVNTPDARLELFDILAKPPYLRHAGSIPVGLEPVSVRARSAGELWVVNHVSDSVSVVDVASMSVKATIATGDEPCDIVFAGTPPRAYISVSGLDRLEVFDAGGTHAPITTIGLAGEMPRALATDGARVYAAFFGAGNETTVLHETVVSSPASPYPGAPNPPPNDGLAFMPACDPALPPAAPASLIVRKDAKGAWRDINGFDWSASVAWGMHGHDLAIIDASDEAVQYARGLMTTPLGMTVMPDGRIVVVGTESRNEIRFEPNLRGIFVRTEAALLAPGAQLPLARGDLNPHLDYTVPQVPPQDRVASIGDPRMVVASSDGTRAYVVGMGSSNIVAFDPLSFARLGRCEIGEGPTGLAVDGALGRIYALNRFASSVSVVDEASFAELARIRFFDPLPVELTRGRRFLYDSHLTSGLGQASCASCHVDARSDGLVWDMGSPDGAMTPFNQVCNLELGLADDCMPWHPMKGPMASQTLLGLAGNEPFHWRGDRAYIANFAHLARTLQGMERDLNETELKHLDDYLTGIAMTPNPNRNRDGSLRALVAGGEPSKGAGLFRNGAAGFMACLECHASPSGGGAGVFSTAVLDDTQPLAIPDLRQAFMKTGFERSSQSNGRGFGFGHDGTGGSLVDFLGTHIAGPIGTGATAQDRRDLAAFVLSWNTGVHASVGWQVTVDGGASSIATRDAMRAVADAHGVELVAKCVIGGEERGFVYRDGALVQDRADAPLSFAMLDAIAHAAPVTYTIVPEGSGARWIDRDGDGYLDGDERARCSDPADPTSTPDAPCRADIAGSTADGADGAIDGSDLALVLNSWGSTGVRADIDCSGSVDGADLSVVLNSWGPCAP